MALSQSNPDGAHHDGASKREFDIAAEAAHEICNAIFRTKDPENRNLFSDKLNGRVRTILDTELLDVTTVRNLTDVVLGSNTTAILNPKTIEQLTRFGWPEQIQSTSDLLNFDSKPFQLRIPIRAGTAEQIITDRASKDSDIQKTYLIVTIGRQSAGEPYRILVEPKWHPGSFKRFKSVLTNENSEAESKAYGGIQEGTVMEVDLNSLQTSAANETLNSDSSTAQPAGSEEELVLATGSDPDIEEANDADFLLKNTTMIERPTDVGYDTDSIPAQTVQEPNQAIETLSAKIDPSGFLHPDSIPAGFQMVARAMVIRQNPSNPVNTSKLHYAVFVDPNQSNSCKVFKAIDANDGASQIQLQLIGHTGYAMSINGMYGYQAQTIDGMLTVPYGQYSRQLYAPWPKPIMGCSGNTMGASLVLSDGSGDNTFVLAY